MAKNTNTFQYVSFLNISSQKLLKFTKNFHSSSAVFRATFTASEAIFTGINLGSKNSPVPRHTLQPHPSSPHHSPVIPPLTARCHQTLQSTSLIISEASLATNLVHVLLRCFLSPSRYAQTWASEFWIFLPGPTSKLTTARPTSEHCFKR